MSADASVSVDVIIIGAGLSGIGAAHYLQERTPDTSYTILEARASLGGTWDLFRYPGVRSDSDLSTFSYEFRPWRHRESIAAGSLILEYLTETASDEGIGRHIQYSRRVTDLAWSSDTGRWTATVTHVDTGESSELDAAWVFCAGGYYRYDEGYSPAFPGADSFAGRIVHPQAWPDDLDWADKKVVVIGSGATAMTIMPAIAGTARHVTMVQRTPTYVLRMPSVDDYAVRMRARHGDQRGHELARRRSIRRQRLIWTLSRRCPNLLRRFIRRVTVRSLPPGYPVDVDFNPPYNPWDQRLCLAPDGDLFHALRDGKASIVTDRIRTFTISGVLLESSVEIEADIIVTATGLNVQLFGGVRLTVDGEPVVPKDHISYRGMMLNDVPNFAYAIGYTNATWTLKVGLLCEYFTRLLNHMDAHGWTVCVPELPTSGVKTRPMLDFGAGYVQRALDSLPRQGDHAPWITSVNYYADVKQFRKAPVQDGSLHFERIPAADDAGRARP